MIEKWISGGIAASLLAIGTWVGVVDTKVDDLERRQLRDDDDHETIIRIDERQQKIQDDIQTIIRKLDQ